MTDITLAIDESALQQLLTSAVDVLEFEYSHSTQGNPRFSIHVKCHLRGGSLTVEPPNPANPIYAGGYLSLEDIVVVWDNLDFGATVHVPPVHFGGECIIPSPFGGCIVSLPSVTFFDCDIGATLPIDDVVRSEISIGLAPQCIQAPGSWEVIPHVVWSDIALLDIADTVVDLVKKLFDALINDLLSFLPDWAKDIIDAIVGGVLNFVRALLNLPNDLINWLSNLLRTSLDVWDLLIQLLVNILNTKLVLAKVDNPLTLLAEQQGPPHLPAVVAPIQLLSVDCVTGEIVMGIDL